MESNYKDHYKARDRDWMTQITAFQDFIKYAIPAKEKVFSHCKEVRNTAASAMLAIGTQQLDFVGNCQCRLNFLDNMRKEARARVSTYLIVTTQK